MEIDAGTVKLKSRELSQNIFWEIKDEVNNTIWRTMKVEPVLILKSGRYKIIAEVENQILAHNIVIESARHIDFEIDPS